MTAAVRAEWVKLTSLQSTLWLVLGVVVVTVGMDAVSVGTAHCVPAACGQDPGKISLVGVDLGQAVVAVLAVLCVTGEYGTGMIRLTLAAMPRRSCVLAAKTLLVSVLVLAAGVAGMLASYVIARVVLPGHGFTVLPEWAMVRACAGSVLYLVLVGVLAVGLAAVLRDGAVAIGAVLGLLYLFPVLTSAFGSSWQRHLQQISPMLAGLDIQATVGLRSLPLAPWEGLGVLALWAFGALLLGGVVLRVRDA